MNVCRTAPREELVPKLRATKARVGPRTHQCLGLSVLAWSTVVVRRFRTRIMCCRFSFSFVDTQPGTWSSYLDGLWRIGTWIYQSQVEDCLLTSGCIYYFERGVGWFGTCNDTQTFETCYTKCYSCTLFIKANTLPFLCDPTLCDTLVKRHNLCFCIATRQ